MKSSKKKSVIILFLLLASILGYSQYQSASEISVNISENKIINEDKNNLNYKIELEFENPSLLTLPVGETKFFIFYDNKITGKGNLESFTREPVRYFAKLIYQRQVLQRQVFMKPMENNMLLLHVVALNGVVNRVMLMLHLLYNN